MKEMQEVTKKENYQKDLKSVGSEKEKQKQLLTK